MKQLFNRLSNTYKGFLFHNSNCGSECASEAEHYKLSVVKEQKIADIDREVEAIDAELNKKNLFVNKPKKHERIKRKEAKNKAKGKLPPLRSGQEDFVRRREELQTRRADLLEQRCLIEEALTLDEIRAIEEKQEVKAYFGKETELLGLHCGTIRSTDVLLREIDGAENVRVIETESCAPCAKKEKRVVRTRIESKEHCEPNIHDRYLLAKYIRLEKDLVCAADSREQADEYGALIPVSPSADYRKLSAKENMLLSTAKYRAKMNSLMLAMKKAALENDDVTYEGKNNSLTSKATFEFEPKNMYVREDDGDEGSVIDKVIVEITRNANGTSEINVTKEFGADWMPFDTDARSHVETMKDSIRTKDCKKIDGEQSYELSSAYADGVADIDEKKTSADKNHVRLDEIIGYFEEHFSNEGHVCDCEAF